jgi:hypothetical protein
MVLSHFCAISRYKSSHSFDFLSTEETYHYLGQLSKHQLVFVGIYSSNSYIYGVLVMTNNQPTTTNYVPLSNEGKTCGTFSVLQAFVELELMRNSRFLL